MLFPFGHRHHRCRDSRSARPFFAHSSDRGGAFFSCSSAHSSGVGIITFSPVFGLFSRLVVVASPPLAHGPRRRAAGHAGRSSRSFVPSAVYARLRADAREAWDETTGETITHGDGSSVVRAHHRPRLTWTT